MKQKILAAVCALALCAALVPAGFAEQAAADTAPVAENPIYSRYVMCGHGTRVEERLLAENWQELVSTEDLVVYKRS